MRPARTFVQHSRHQPKLRKLARVWHPERGRVVLDDLENPGDRHARLEDRLGLELYVQFDEIAPHQPPRWDDERRPIAGGQSLDVIERLDGSEIWLRAQLQCLRPLGGVAELPERRLNDGLAEHLRALALARLELRPDLGLQRRGHADSGRQLRLQRGRLGVGDLGHHEAYLRRDEAVDRDLIEVHELAQRTPLLPFRLSPPPLAAAASQPSTHAHR